MEATNHLIRPVEADLCRDCPFATFRALPVDHTPMVVIFCRRLDCDNMETSPLEPLPDLAALRAMPLAGEDRSIAQRVWQHIVSRVRSVW